MRRGYGPSPDRTNEEKRLDSVDLMMNGVWPGEGRSPEAHHQNIFAMKLKLRNFAETGD
jgi:hypothetical protein